MNHQEMLDTAVNGIIAQGGPAKSGGVCLYLDEDTGRRCAVGLLMTEEEIAKYGDAPGNVSALLKLAERDLENVRSEDLEFLSLLQNMHDALGVGNWDRYTKNVLVPLLASGGDPLSLTEERLTALKEIYEGV